MSGTSANHMNSPAVDRLLDDDADSANERWSDRFSFVAKDSYGNLRCAFFHPLHQYEVVDVDPQFHRGNILDDVRRSFEFFERPRVVCWVSSVKFI